AAASTPAQLEEARVRYLGRKSELAQGLRAVRDRETGMTLNSLRDRLEAAVAARRQELERAELDRALTEEVVDVTLPGDRLPLGHLHPITQTRRQIEDAFLGLGYEIRDDREVETVEYNFDKLAFDPWHPARSHRATFFFDNDRLLRTETSPSQIHALEEREPPIYMVSIGRCYRRDDIDATHYPIFHQFEGLAVDRQPLELVEDRVVRGVDVVAPVAAADRDHVDRWLPLLERVDLARRGLRAQQPVVVEEEGRPVGARRVPRVERELVEVVLDRLDLAV